MQWVGAACGMGGLHNGGTMTNAIHRPRETSRLFAESIEQCKALLPKGEHAIRVGQFVNGDTGCECEIVVSNAALRTLSDPDIADSVQDFMKELTRQLRFILELCNVMGDQAMFGVGREFDDGTEQDLVVHKNMEASPPFVFITLP